MKYDSKEELYFSWYLDELKEAKYVMSYESQPESYVLSEPVLYDWQKQLKTKRKLIVKKLMRGHVYTTDFKINWAYKAREVFFDSIYGQIDLSKVSFITPVGRISIIEVKPVFDQNNMTRLFTINQKWVWQKYGIYVQKIIPVKLFEATFTPKRYLLTDKSMKPRKLKYKPKSLNDFIAKKH